jgi:hypothetical protein
MAAPEARPLNQASALLPAAPARAEPASWPEEQRASEPLVQSAARLGQPVARRGRQAARRAEGPGLPERTAAPTEWSQVLLAQALGRPDLDQARALAPAVDQRPPESERAPAVRTSAEQSHPEEAGPQAPARAAADSLPADRWAAARSAPPAERDPLPGQSSSASQAPRGPSSARQPAAARRRWAASSSRSVQACREPEKPEAWPDRRTVHRRPVCLPWRRTGRRPCPALPWSPRPASAPSPANSASARPRPRPPGTKMTQPLPGRPWFLLRGSLPLLLVATCPPAA